MQRSANPLFLKVFSNGCRRIAFFGVVLVTLGGCALLRGGPKIGDPGRRWLCGQGPYGGAPRRRWLLRRVSCGSTRPDRDEIDLWGPIGQGHSRLVGGRKRGHGVRRERRGLSRTRYRRGDAALAWVQLADRRADALDSRRAGAAVSGRRRTPIAASGDLSHPDQLSWRIEFSGPSTRSMADARLPMRDIVAMRGDIRRSRCCRRSGHSGPQNAFDTP